jgi:hypothetical protein
VAFFYVAKETLGLIGMFLGLWPKREKLLFLLLLLAHAHLGICAFAVNFDVGGHAAVPSAPLGGGIWEDGAIFSLSHTQDSFAILALGIYGTAGATQEGTAFFGHE